MLVIDLHTLQAVHLLNLIDDVLSQGRNALESQNVVGAERPFRHDFALLDGFALKHRQLTPLRNQLFVVIRAIRQGCAIGRRNHQTTLALGLFAEADGAGDFREDRRLLRLTCFEQIGNPGQTTGNVACLRAFLWDAGNHVTHLHIGTIFQIDHRAMGQEVVRRYVGARQHQLLTLAIHERYRRTDVLARGRPLCNVHDRDTGQTGKLVGLTLNGNALVHTAELYCTCHLGDDRVGVRIPCSNDVASRD